jgi:hypothetical protein
MIGKSSTRQMYASLGPARFARQVRHLLGVSDQKGQRYTDRLTESHVLRDPMDSKGAAMGPRLRPTDFSLRDLAECIVGDDWSQKMRPDIMQQASLMEQARPLVEAGTGAVMPSAFADINAFTAVVAGLLEVSVMEGWQNPEFIADQLMPTENTRMFEGRKVIGTTRIGDLAEPRLPGNPTKRAQFGERWITQARTVENALSCEVTQEAVYLDLTGEVLEQANSVGDWIGWRKELRTIDAFIGVTNTYVYSGTGYNSYLTSGYFTNSLTGNELLHWTNIQTIELLFRDMLDPATNTRVRIQPNRILVNQEKWYTLMAILKATSVEYRDIPGSTSAAQQIRHFENPLKGYTALTSPLVYQRCTDASGLNLSASNAGKIMWVWEAGKFAKYAQNWPQRVQQAAPNQADMIDRGVVLFVKADERGIPMIYEPRRSVQSAA